MLVRGLKTEGLIEEANPGRPHDVRVTMRGWRQAAERPKRQRVPPLGEGSKTQERDVFLCHASCDKETTLRPLRAALDAAGIAYWYDEAEIGWGDSIVSKVNEGLRTSRFVLVVLSRGFLGRPWPEHELSAALNAEASSGVVKVLPLLCGSQAERDQIIEHYPLLGGKRYEVFDEDPSALIHALKDRLSQIAGCCLGPD
jgi:hypothetical protein